MDNGEEEVGQESLDRGISICVCSVMMMVILSILYVFATQRQHVGSLSSSTTSITSNRNVLLAKLTTLQTALFHDRLNTLITVNSNTDIARGLTPVVFPRNVSGFFLGEWDDSTTTATGTATTTGTSVDTGNAADYTDGGGFPRMFPWNLARNGGFMVRQHLTLTALQ